jgi:hypothetical protein
METQTKMSQAGSTGSEDVTRAAATVVASGEADIFDKFNQVLHRAAKKNAKPADVQALRELLDEHADAQLWRCIGGLAQSAELALLANDNIPPVLRECWARRLAALRDELGDKDAPQAERLLIAHAALCWLRLSLLEVFAGQSLNQSISLPQAMFTEKRLEVAQRRFTRAVESLAKVRALTAATRLIESRTEAASAAKRVNNVRTVNALTA